MDTVIKSVICSAAVMVIIIGCRIFKNRILGQNTDNTCPTLYNPQWKKIGRVDDLIIYPVKSSEQPVRYDSFAFRDYGMCRKEYGTYIWDGMFLVYNKTKDKFEDSRRYRFLRSILANLTNIAEVTLSSNRARDTVKLDVGLYRSPNCIMKEIWNGTSETYCCTNVNVNTWLKEVINANEIVEPNEIDEANEDISLVQLLPRNWDSTQRIKENWSHFVQGYEAMERNIMGKFVTLPRFVLMTSKTFVKLDTKYSMLTPNIIVETGKAMNPFEEENWDWIRIGDNVILKNIKPVLRYPPDEQFHHFGIYCGLWTGGNVKLYDKVYVHYSDK